MNAAKASVTDVTHDSRVRIPVDRRRWIEAFAAKGATDDQARADLLGRTRKQVWQYRLGYMPPTLLNAREIADVLGVHIDELWPHDYKAAA